jgi:dihydroorotate dehydrogenase
LLFSLDPERAHECAGMFLKVLAGSPALGALISPFFASADPRLKTRVNGLEFSNPVGLAAGFDKGAEMLSAFRALGFGFAETGTFTPLPQEGNPRPRLLRRPREKALFNAMGFNNPGGLVALERLQNVRRLFERHPALKIPLGINIGKGHQTPIEEGGADYLANFERLYPVADYIVLNVSSPNTPHLRRLEQPQALRPLLTAVQARNQELARAAGQTPRPVFVKISPDLPEEDLKELALVLLSLGAGAIATNTAHQETVLPDGRTLSGGLSGEPLSEVSTRTIRTLFQASGKRLSIIGVGGISGPEAAYRKIRAGAAAVQVYTGWIYEGPALVKRINTGLLRQMERDGFKNINEAVGTEQ